MSFDLSLDLTLADLKGFVNAKTAVPPESQQFFLNNQPVHGDDTRSLTVLGVKAEDMLAMLIRKPGQQSNMGAPPNPQPNSGALRVQGEQDIEMMRQRLLNDPRSLQAMREQRPALADAIQDRVRFRDALMQMEREAAQVREDRLEQMRQLNENAFDEESQRRIEEMIRQESVQENLQFAYEHSPEGKQHRQLCGTSIADNSFQFSAV